MNDSDFDYDLNGSCHFDQLQIENLWGQYVSHFPLAYETQPIHDRTFCRPSYRSLQQYGKSTIEGNHPGGSANTHLSPLPVGQIAPEAVRREWEGPQISQSQRLGEYNSQETEARSTHRKAGVGRTANAPGAKYVASAAMSQSECCSSCSGGVLCVEPDCTPCNAEDCSLKDTKVVPCNRQSCEQPTCSDLCLNTSIQDQPLITDYGIIQAGRPTNWLDSPWNPQMPRCTTESIQGSLHEVVDPALQLLALAEPPIPLPSSMGDNFPTPFSQQTGPSTVEDGELSQAINSEQPTNNLVGTGALFEPSADEPAHQFFEGSHGGNSTPMVQCAWDGCGQQVYYQDWFPHLHYNHVDPQMTFGCPLAVETCPERLSQNPVDHLQNDHGINFNFDMNSGGFSCPAPDCLPSETYLDPAMLHKHFDHAHAIPAWGSLQCRLDTCDTTFQDPNEFFSHINEVHTFPQPSMPSLEEDIDLNAPPDLGKVAQPRQKSVEHSLYVIPEAVKSPKEPTEEEVAHCCQWMIDGKMCGAKFDSEGYLQTHIKDHLKDMNKSTGYICQWDGCERENLGDKAGFSQRGKLERHMHSHTNYKDSRCDWPGCGQMFSAPQALKQHYRRHTGEKPWKCDEPGCGKSFTQQSSLTCHMRKHTKNKPLICQTCGKVFSESTNLSKHRSKVHGETGKHVCTWPHCEKTFHRISQLRTHVKEHRRKSLAPKECTGISESGSAVTGSE